MKQWHFNLICFILATATGIGTFMLKYYVRDKEKNLKQLHYQIVLNRRELHGLQTDWASLTNPEHLRQQAEQTKAQPILANQIIQADELAERPIKPPTAKPDFEEGKNEI
ncbi:MAG: hypothetical protein E7021_00755 [Alphaproteobacteria bacterium]|nr:hypothetical protein [Alphaproteobacteria bacterium]